ncbi:MAG: site-specific integrase [Kiritimatiellaeota bacterium]|nr:site-specific integrase [Kiritimatiellota bacterium]
MSPLRSRFCEYMILRGFSPRTHESYLHAMIELARYYRRSPDQLSNEEIQAFLVHVITVRRLSWSTVNVYFSAYRCFYEKVLHWDRADFHIPPRGRSHHRPFVLSRQAVKQILQAPRNLKHRALLAMVYGSGLRVSEVCCLRPHHIESSPDRMMVRVEQGKGHKDRYTILSQAALDILRNYWRAYRPGPWLFFGRDKLQPLDSGTALHIYYQACNRAGVSEAHGIHSLRHAFATHLMENGVPLFSIKRWLGHSALATTAGYCHVTSEHLHSVVSPLDCLPKS